MTAEEEGLTRGFWPSLSKVCDSCKASPALVFCRVDSVFLCLSCDAAAHPIDQLASRHDRVWMCEVCEQAPACVTCKADGAALCHNCDVDIHSANPFARRHERHPLLPFFKHSTSSIRCQNTGIMAHYHGPRSTADSESEIEAASWLLPAPMNKLVEPIDMKQADYCLSGINLYPDLDYTAPMDANLNLAPTSFSDNGVQVHPDPAATLLPSGFDQNYVDTDYSLSNNSYNYQSLSQSVSSSSLDAIVPDGTDSSYVSSVRTGMEHSGAGAAQLSGVDREARVLRYREKRKNRKFEKTIRYASRKAYAETRPRIKGRFAKRTEPETEVGQIYCTASLLPGNGFGIVPSF